ncbi:proline racemase [Daphnia sinensis]|uniref:Proline racemase n=1 Tax=Daphnia sinensis TaxID=1820382 RepID=A0AAD5L341_9CRUS|nr:proline racemase [Daphnia sinensis]
MISRCSSSRRADAFPCGDMEPSGRLRSPLKRIDPSQTPGFLRMEAPAGLVLVEYKQEGKKVKSVKLTNVKSFLAAENLEIESDELGKLKVDVAYGGNFYCIIDPQENFPCLEHFKAEQLISMARSLRTRMNEKYEFVHPEHPSIRGLSHVLWTGKTLDPTSTARNAVFYGDKAIDRSPCGTGTSAAWHSGMPRLAQTWSRFHS